MNKTYLKNLSDEELKKLFDNDTIEHYYVYEEDEEWEDGNVNYDYESEPIHYYWDCDLCEIEKELKKRRSAKEKTMPGNIPYNGNVVMKNVTADDLAVGDCVKFYPKPGTFYNYYVECLSVKKNDNVVVAEWRKTNTEEISFTADYDNKDSVDIVRPLKSKKKK